MDPEKTESKILLAGATGHLGGLIARQLRARGAAVRALVRPGADVRALANLRSQGCEIKEVQYRSAAELAAAGAGCCCLVSALSGLRPVIVDAQTMLLEGALKSGIARFVPSDYCIDFTKLPAGRNRNLDLRREFAERLDAAPIKATSVLNGMFAELLNGPAPLFVKPLHRVLYWGSAEQKLDFTTMENTAAFTAAAVLDPQAPRWLRIAGDVLDVKGLQQAAEAAWGKPWKRLRAGGLGALRTLIRITKLVAPQSKEVFPAWQGMQYLHDMFEGKVKLEPLDNGRYPGIYWTGVAEVLRAGSDH